MADLSNEYFDWICSQVANDRQKLRYSRLLSYLFRRDFYEINPMDSNRAEDGVNLRYAFADHKRIEHSRASIELDIHPCSILEMMVALAKRCEIHIMNDPDIGDRTGMWFWQMIGSLGLGDMTNEAFNIKYVNDILYTFLEREYLPNGKGGLFTLHNPSVDMRTIEIWYQLCLYLREEISVNEN